MLCMLNTVSFAAFSFPRTMSENFGHYQKPLIYQCMYIVEKWNENDRSKLT